MNANTIYQPARIPREGNQGGTSTSETVVTSDGTLPVILPLPTDSKLAAANATAWAQNNAGGPRGSSKFTVRAFGRMAAAAGNCTIKLYFGTSATVGSNTAIATTGAVAIASSSNWFLQCQLVWDADSKKINGFYEGQLGTTTVAATTITNPITSGADPGGGATLGFVVTFQFATGAAANKFYLDGFFLVLD